MKCSESIKLYQRWAQPKSKCDLSLISNWVKTNCTNFSWESSSYKIQQVASTPFPETGFSVKTLVSKIWKTIQPVSTFTKWRRNKRRFWDNIAILIKLSTPRSYPCLTSRKTNWVMIAVIILSRLSKMLLAADLSRFKYCHVRPARLIKVRVEMPSLSANKESKNQPPMTAKKKTK